VKPLTYNQGWHNVVLGQGCHTPCEVLISGYEEMMESTVRKIKELGEKPAVVPLGPL
jgi:hypothetical protein